jgi:hypothetical protein
MAGQSFLDATKRLAYKTVQPPGELVTTNVNCSGHSFSLPVTVSAFPVFYGNHDQKRL